MPIKIQNDLPVKEIPPLLMWRATANNLYTNWLNYYVYQTTPYDLYGTPDFSEFSENYWDDYVI